jgi:WD40 repeat protein
VTAFDCADSWLVAGCEDGSITITDLASGECTTKFRHGSGSGDRYRGVTNIHCLPTLPGQRAPLFFSACSNGILKAWAIPAPSSAQSPSSPTQGASSSNYWGIRMNLRLKQSLAVVKVHTAPVACLTARPVLDATHTGWLLASGDERGLVCLTRGSEKSSSTTCASASISANTARMTPDGRPAPPVFSGSKLSISCLAFIGAPTATATTDAATAGAKGKGAKKGVPASAAAGVPGGGVVATGAEEYLGVGTSTGLISVLDLTTAQPVYQVVGHAGKVTQMIGLHCNEFISCSVDRTIKLWDIRTRNRPTQTYPGRILEERSFGANTAKRCATSPITAIAVGGGDSSLVISTSADGVVRLWDRRYDVNVPCSISHGHSSRITSIAWNGTGEFHTASHDGTVRTWDSINGQNTYTLQAFDEEGITGMKMATFKCAQHVTITPRGPVTFIDPEKPSLRTCLVTTGWNGTIRGFVCDVQ